MTRGVPLTLACGDYDRTRALHEGSVVPEGVDLTTLRLPVEEIFFRMARFQEFDAAELSFSSYLLTLDDDGVGPFVAIPVFPSRAFRHNGIYVHVGGGVRSPFDLIGKTVGVPEYQVTAAVWIRGILAEHHDVPVNSVHYRTGGLHETGRVEKVKLELPSDVDVQPIGPDKTLAQMLVDGEIDALYSPRSPAPFLAGRPEVRRLFRDAREVEAAYFAKTGIFPIMHVIALRRDVYLANRWLARSLTKAFEQAKADALQGIDETAALRYMLPWLPDEVARTREILGDDYWSYGAEPNRHTIQTLVGYSHSQGLATRRYRVDQLFAPETLDVVRV
ncbi:MAG TPA: ABC transporter substrate-binding protein [Pseudonocardiaceae bacterium]|jgi:4,5-dihydroxyphthalate decarboxylase|nr:ABC transporter substrate-binding protein [Pseudonocardiaceae bacterium]